MALTDLSSRDAVLRATRECDALGEDEFLRRHGFGPSLSIRLFHEGRAYPAKAIAGVAHGVQFPERGILPRTDLSGGEPLIRKLVALGFDARRFDESTEAPSVRPDAGSGISDLLDRGLAAVREGTTALVKQRIGDELPAMLEGVLGGERPVSSGTGVGTTADVPWAGVHPAGTAATAKEGVYAVYLFARDGSAVYLSFNQGTENVSGGTAVLRKRSLDMRDAAGIAEAGDPVDLRSKNQRPRRYEAGSAYAIRYEAGAIPDDAAVLVDLERVLGYVDAAVASDMQFDAKREPLHVLFKWSRERGPDTLEEHRTVAQERGRTWWGKLGDKPVSQAKISALREQLAEGVATYAFLYGDQKLVRAKLHAVTDDPDEVLDDERPASQPKEQSSFFACLSDFEDLPVGWAQRGLVLASDADPAKMQGALSNQTTPLFVLERFAAQLTSDAAPNLGPELTLGWLADETLWTREQLEELLEALDPSTGKGQVILAGPPGTGKTWVAERVARYLTQDLPLHHRLVQFHPSYGYEEFVEGIRPVARAGGIAFEVVKGTVLAMAEAIEDQSDVHVLIIDELNRANVPRVFGELLYLLEYRDEAIELQYSESFALPSNLRFVATMNTADRSVRSIDVALRRRFEVFECPADQGILERFYQRPENTTSVPDLVEGFGKLNDALAEQLDRHHTIGQSFFMRSDYDRGQLERTWRRQILPLIEDYFFDRPDVVAEFSIERFWAAPAP